MDQMEHINLVYSLKNIPISTHSTYQLLLTEKIESLIKRMRCKARFYLKGINNQDNTNNFNLKSRKFPPICKDMQAFENDQTDMVTFTNHRHNFQKKIKNDTKKYTTQIRYLYSLTNQPIHILQISPTTKSWHQTKLRKYTKKLPKSLWTHK